MKLLLILTALVAAEAASTAGKCRLSEWGPWQERHPREDRTGKSFPVERQQGDVGGFMERKHMMKLKADLAENRRQCIADGTCPELAPGASEGAIPCVDGFIDGPQRRLPCRSVNQQAFLNFDDLMSPGSTSGNDIWGWTDPVNGEEYALMMMTTGTAFVSLAEPTAPVTIAFLPTETSSSTWRDGKVVNDWAFIVSEASNHGIQAFDLSRLRTMNPGTRVEADYVIGDVGNCHNIISNPDRSRIYAVGCTSGDVCPGGSGSAGGLFMVDVSDPSDQNPRIRCYPGDGYVHDGQCLTYTGPDPNYFNHDICFCYNEDTFTIVDAEEGFGVGFSQISRTGYAGSAYTHQGWLSEDMTIALLDDELDEQNGNGELRTYMWDITDLANPILRNTHWHGLQSIDHNQYVLGDMTYQANYATGLRILQINPDFTLEERGFFDVFPAGDVASFVGAWSVYPYFASGNIIISSIENGLYVVQFSGAVPKDESMVERLRYRSILSAGDGVCANLQESQWV